MGYAKYYEDDNEIMLGRMKHSQDYHKTNSHIQHYECPYCNLIKYSKNNLFEHIKKEHNIAHPVIVVNGKVINQEEYIVAAIENLNVFTYGFADELFLNDEKYYCSETDDIDLTHQAKNIFDLKNEVVINIGEKRLIIKKYSISEIRAEWINPIIND